VADLVVDGTDLVVAMGRVERFWAFRRQDLRVPLSSVRRLRVPVSPWLVLRGWRVDGVAVPGWIAMGRRRHGQGYDFSLVRHSGPALIVELNGQPFGQLVVSVPDAAETGRRIAAAAGIAFDPTPDRSALPGG
jgi:hypothetical protein